MKPARQILTRRAVAVLLTALFLLGIAAVLAIGVGSVYIPPARVLRTLFNLDDPNSTEHLIIHNMRLTRVCASLFGGAALALAGLLLQILFANPIADPYVLGISSGARLFVGLTLLGGLSIGLRMDNPWFMFAGALAGSLLIMLAMLGFAARMRQVTTLLIIGIMLGYLCSALVGLLTAFSDDHSLADFTRWNMGSFGLMTWPKIQVLAIVSSSIFILSWLSTKKLNALLLGEAYARTMGVNTRLLRFTIILFSGVLTAVVTAFAGLVAFIGMSVPHIARLLLKTGDARILLPVTFILGGTFGVACDLVARTIIAPNELAVGTVTSFVGVPIVLYLLMHKNKVRS